jgi:hypothetical protein
MPSFTEAVKFICVVLGAAILGNWFLAELKKSQHKKLPWYTAYLSPPGLLILAALLIPLIYWLAKR